MNQEGVNTLCREVRYIRYGLERFSPHGTSSYFLMLLVSWGGLVLGVGSLALPTPHRALSRGTPRSTHLRAGSHRATGHRTTLTKQLETIKIFIMYCKIQNSLLVKETLQVNTYWITYYNFRMLGLQTQHFN